MLTLLDTRDLIEQFRRYDHVFSFLERRAADAVRLAVLRSGVVKKRLDELEGVDLEVYWMNSFAGLILERWHASLDARETRFVHELPEPVNYLMIISVCLEIERAVNLHLEQLLETHHYQIDALEDGNDWLFGDDLLVEVHYGREVL